MAIKHFAGLVLASAAAFGAGSYWHPWTGPQAGAVGLDFDEPAAERAAPPSESPRQVDPQRVVENADGSRAVYGGDGSSITVSNGQNVTVTMQGGSATVSYNGQDLSGAVVASAEYNQREEAEQAQEDEEEEAEEVVEAAAPCPTPPAVPQAKVKAKLAAKAAAARVAVAAAPSGAAWAKGSYVDASDKWAYEKEMAGGQPTLVIFHALWCPYCKAYLPKARAWAAEHGVKVVAVDAEKRPDLAKAAGVKGYPTTLGAQGAGFAAHKESGNLGAAGLAAYAKKWGRIASASEIQVASAAAAAAQEAGVAKLVKAVAAADAADAAASASAKEDSSAAKPKM